MCLLIIILNNLQITYITFNKNNVGKLSELENFDPGFLERFMLSTRIKNQEIYLDKSNLSKN